MLGMIDALMMTRYLDLRLGIGMGMQILRNGMQLPMHTSFLFVFISACAFIKQDALLCCCCQCRFPFNISSLVQVHPLLGSREYFKGEFRREAYESSNVYQYYSNWTIEWILKAHNINPHIHFCFLFTVSLSCKSKVSYTCPDLPPWSLNSRRVLDCRVQHGFPTNEASQ